MPVIEVTISPQGETKLETRGFVGAACQEATRTLEAALGLVESDEKTAAYYQASLPETLSVVPSDPIE